MSEWGEISWGCHVSKSATISEKVVEERALKRQIANEELHTMVAKRLDDLCVRPLPGEQWRIITEKAFNAYAFICSLLAEGNIDELWIAIYRINEPTVNSLIDLVRSGRIKRAHFIISAFFNQTKKPEQWAKKLCGFCANNPNKTSFAYLHNHAKVVCAHRGGGFLRF